MLDVAYHIVSEAVSKLILIASDPIFIGICILTLYMYKRSIRYTPDKRYQKQVQYIAIKDIIRGTLAGILMSLILEWAQISIYLTKELILIFPIVFLLFFIKNRWCCFAYVVPITYIIHQILYYFKVLSFRYPENYQNLILLVGLLHLIEGCLVMWWGKEAPKTYLVPMENSTAKLHMLLKYWPIPLIMKQQAQAYMLYGFLGYKDLVVGDQIEEKSIKSGGMILFFGLFTVGLGYMSILYTELLPLFLLGMSMGHELLFILNKG